MIMRKGLTLNLLNKLFTLIKSYVDAQDEGDRTIPFDGMCFTDVPAEEGEAWMAYYGLPSGLAVYSVNSIPSGKVYAVNPHSGLSFREGIRSGVSWPAGSKWNDNCEAKRYRCCGQEFKVTEYVTDMYLLRASGKEVLRGSDDGFLRHTGLMDNDYIVTSGVTLHVEYPGYPEEVYNAEEVSIPYKDSETGCWSEVVLRPRRRRRSDNGEWQVIYYPTVVGIGSDTGMCEFTLTYMSDTDELLFSGSAMSVYGGMTASVDGDCLKIKA